MAPESSTTATFQLPPDSDPESSSRPPSCSTEVILIVRPVVTPLMIFCPTSTLRTGGRLTVDALPRTHTDGSLHTMTVLIAHCMGFEPSYGGAAPAVAARASRTTIDPTVRSRWVVRRRVTTRADPGYSEASW